MNKKGLKRLKRKKELARRRRCHSNSTACSVVHPVIKKKLSSITDYKIENPDRRWWQFWKPRWVKKEN